jgi:hypothetical protein
MLEGFWSLDCLENCVRGRVAAAKLFVLAMPSLVSTLCIACHLIRYRFFWNHCNRWKFRFAFLCSCDSFVFDPFSLEYCGALSLNMIFSLCLCCSLLLFLPFRGASRIINWSGSDVFELQAVSGIELFLWSLPSWRIISRPFWFVLRIKRSFTAAAFR